MTPLQGRSFWESSPPMGPPENPTAHPENQEGWRRRLPCRPRMRLCLMKGYEQRFHPRHARQRYCSEGCRAAARKWSRRKAQERYRETAAGQQMRNGQSRRYRERGKSRKPPEPETVSEPGRVITTEHFFFDHSCDRPNCYEGIRRTRRSPLQHFCSQECRRALERVRERERRWKQARDLIRRY